MTDKNKKLPYSGRTSSYAHKSDENWREADTSKDSAGVTKITVLNAQWSTCPIEVENQVRDLWRLYELRNDSSVIKTSIEDLLEIIEDDETMVERWIIGEDGVGSWTSMPLQVDYIVQYLREMNVGEDEEVWIHWWW